MPITAKFSKTFYDTLGHEIADEMVNWFNQADTVYRTQLRELNDLNYARFAAKLEQLDAKMDRRFAEQDAKWDTRFTELNAKWDTRFAELDAKWETRFAVIDGRFSEQDAKWERRFGEGDTRWERRFGDLNARVDKLTAIVEAQPHAIQAHLLKWMVVLWATTILAIAGLR